MTRKGKRVFIYVRVSTQEQAKEGYSIDEQIKRLKKYCDAHDWIIVKIYTDAGYSGGNTDRPALQDMIKDIKARKGDCVVVYKLDRLSRSQKDTLELIEDYFLANDVDFVSMNEKFDTSTPFGRAMIGILAVFAQLEREQIKERMAMGREGRAKEGKWIGCHYSPIGYDYVDGELIINEFDKMQIVEMFDLYCQGYSIRQIDRLFYEKGYRHKHGAWEEKRIRIALQNKLYIGYVSFEGKYYKGIHTPIIDEETFEKVQQIMDSRRVSHASTRQTSYLGGLIYCKKCTARYGVDNNHGYKYYVCHSRRKRIRSMIKNPNCKNKTYRQEKLENIIFDEIRKLALDPNYIHEIKQENFSQEDVDKETLIKKQIEKIDAQRKRIMNLYKIEEYTLEEVQKEVSPLNEQKKRLEEELHNLTADKSTMTEEEVYEIVSSFNDVFERGNREEIRLMIESLIDHIDIDEENVFVHWKFA